MLKKLLKIEEKQSKWLAVDYPEKVVKPAIVISASRQNDTIRQVIGSWITPAEEGAKEFANSLFK